MRVRMRSRAYAGAVQVEVKPRRRAITLPFPHCSRQRLCFRFDQKLGTPPYMAATLHDSWGRIEGVAARVTGAGRGADGRPTVRVRTCIRPRCI